MFSHQYLTFLVLLSSPIRQQYHDEDKRVRITAAQTLKHFGERVPIEPLIAALHDIDANVRMEAMRALGHLGERAPVDSLAAAINDEDKGVREVAVQILGQLGEQAPIEPIVAGLRDKDERVRIAAAQTVGHLGERVPVEPLIAALQAIRDESVDVRAAAARALGHLGERVPVEPLVAALSDSRKKVREAALEAIQQMNSEILHAMEREATMILVKQEPGEVFRPLIEGFIADIIGSMDQSSPVLLQRLTELLDPRQHRLEVQMKAARAMGKLRRNIPNEAIRRLLELRRNPQSRTMRNVADDALMEILSLETGIEDD